MAITSFQAMTFCCAMSGLNRSRRMRRADVLAALAGLTEWRSVRTGADGACSSARERTAPTRSRRRPALTSRTSRVALVDATRSRMIDGQDERAQHVTGSATHPSRRFPGRNRSAWSRRRDVRRRTVVADDRAGGVLALEFERRRRRSW